MNEMVLILLNPFERVFCNEVGKRSVYEITTEIRSDHDYEDETIAKRAPSLYLVLLNKGNGRRK